MNVSQLYIYPIKSLGGIAVNAVNITDRGFEYDRRWMLIDNNNRFLSQREISEMALLQVEMLQHGLKVYHKKEVSNFIEIPFGLTIPGTITVDIWETLCEALLVSPDADKWFSAVLNFPCRLVYMPDSTKRQIDKRYAISVEDITSFADGYPILMISEASLQDLNNKTEESIPVERFRPNMVFSGGYPFIEDTMKEFAINECKFFGVKPSARCVITTINPHTGQKGKEPLKALSAYRRKESRVYFGENVIAASAGRISISDPITILQTKDCLFNHQE